MTNFVKDNTTLEFPKFNRKAVPAGQETRYIAAEDWNELCQGATDARDWIRAAEWYGLKTNVSDPLPAGITNYVWLKSDGSLWMTLNGVATEIFPAGHFTSIDATGNVTLAGSLPGLSNTGQLVRATVTGVASTAGDCETIRAVSTGTYDTTASTLDVNCILASTNVVRSAGANPLTTTAINGTAAGAQTNTALKGTANGTAANTGLHVTAAGGTTNVAIDADNGGDVSLCGATDKLGFYGTAPIAKQTGVAVSAAAIHAALVALGLISA